MKREKLIHDLENRWADFIAMVLHLDRDLHTLWMRLDLSESRIVNMEEKVLAFEKVIEVAWEEAIQVIARYKASTEFENEISEAVCDAFYKGFEECKVALTFDHLDLRDSVGRRRGERRRSGPLRPT